jgi:TPR repeat protein
VEKSPEKAVSWWIKAAKQCHLYAQFNLAHYYQHGIGIAQSLEKSLFWNRKLMKQGHPQNTKQLRCFLSYLP